MATQSKLVPCKICGELFRARGLHGHMKLKHGKFALITTQVIVSTIGDSGDDSGKLKNKKMDSGQKPLINTTKPTVSVTTKQPNFLESEYMLADKANFQPRMRDYIPYFRRNPEAARKEWKKMVELKKKYAWAILINEVRYMALEQVVKELQMKF